MDNSDAFEALASDDVPARLRAARHLTKRATSADLANLRRFAISEPDELVARVLRRRVSELSNTREPLSSIAGLGPSDEVLQMERARGRRDAIAMFLHEVSPQIGQLEVVASTIMEPYEGSPLEAEIELVRNVLLAFEDLRSAADAGDLQEVNLTDLVTAVVRHETEKRSDVVLRDSEHLNAPEAQLEDDESQGRAVDVRLTRRDPVITFGSPRLLQLILRNAVSNAFDACRECLHEKDSRVTVSWGATDIDAWISVVDDCLGLPARDVWPVGVTSKDESHRGMGLVVVEQAVESLRGTVTLRDAETGGAAFEVRWPVEERRS